MKQQDLDINVRLYVFEQNYDNIALKQIEVGMMSHVQWAEGGTMKRKCLHPIIECHQ